MLTNAFVTTLALLFYHFSLFSLADTSSSLPFISHFEKLNYDPNAVHRAHLRSRRSSDSASNSPVRISLTYGDRNFQLLLKPDTSAFSSEHTLDTGDINRASVADLSFLYEGRVEDDPNSYVYGSVLDGVFDGHIHTGTGAQYHVERVAKYVTTSTQPSAFHSVIYSGVMGEDDDIDHSKVRIRRSESGAAPSCGFHGSTEEWMDSVQRSAVGSTWSRSKFNDDAVDVGEEAESFRQPPWQLYTVDDRQAGKRSRRNANGLYDVRTCSMYMQADQKLWEFIFNHEGQRNEERTRNEILSLFNSHVKAVNAIYENTNFNGINGINFVVQRTTIFDNRSCPSFVDADEGNPFCEDNVDVSNFLNLNSIKNHSDFCLAYALTYRDFVGGTLGLAWVASRQPNTSGGICELYKPYSEGTRKVRRSLNTGIITLVNYHNRVPPKVSQLTLAHEIGHNFGSPHDFPSECQPGLPDGNYIMFASATSGDKVNNGKFSTCSVSNISLVLSEVLRQDPNAHMLPSAKRNCFKRRETSFCGNAMVEEGEECDCGFNKEECEQRGDSCCYPRTHAGEQKGCTRKEGKVCSPSEGVCCSPTCNFVSLDAKFLCRQATECSKDQLCNGVQASCPQSDPQNNGTLCQENTKVCSNGICSKSVCNVINMDECFITAGSPEDQCVLACKKHPNAKCVPSYQIEALRSRFVNDKGILLRPGSPCNDYRGYCDIFRKCRSVDANGPLSRLKNLFFNHETLKSLSQWITENWWATLLMGLALIFIMALFIRCCAVHTPSTNPRKPPAHSIYETLRHPSTLLRHNAGYHERHHHHHHHQGRNRSRSYEQQQQQQRRQCGQRPTRAHRSRNSGQQRGGGRMPDEPEPPPPYSSAVAGGMGPPRGHRKHRKRDRCRELRRGMEMRPT